MINDLLIKELREKLKRMEAERNELRKKINDLKSNKLKNDFDQHSILSDGRLQILFNNLMSGYALHEIITDSNNNVIDCKYLYVNKKFEEIIGIPAKKVIGHTLSKVSPNIEPFWLQTYADVALNGKTIHFEQYSILLDKYLEVVAYSPEKGKFITIFTDITEIKKRENILNRKNRALKIYGLLGKLISEINDENDFLNKICELIVTDGGYKLSWIGKVDYSNQKKVIPVASSGYDKGYIESLNITWAETPYGKGPTGTSIRLKKPVASNNIEDDVNFTVWKEQAMLHGFKSSVSIPIFFDGVVYASLNMYAEETDAFDTNEIEILKDVSLTISNGLELIRTTSQLAESNDMLTDSYDKISAALAAIPDVIIEVDKAGQIIDIYSEGYELNAENEINSFGKSLKDFYNPAVSKKLIKANRQVWEEWKKLKLEYELEFFNEKLFFEAVFSPKGKKENKNASVIISIRDISDLHESIESIKEKEENLSVTLNSIGDGVIVTDIKGYITRINLVAQQLTGWPEKEAINKHIDEIFIIHNNDTGKKVANPVKIVLKEGTIVGLANHTVLTSKKGEKYHIADSAAPIKRENGELIGVVMVFRNISDKYLYEKLISEKEERYRIVSEQTGQLIYDYDIISGRILWSGAIEDITGYTPDEFNTIDINAWEQMIHPEDRKNALRELTISMASCSKYNVEYRFFHKKGHYIYIKDDGLFLSSKNKKEATRMLGSMKDITKDVVTANALKDSEKRFRVIAENAPYALALIDKNGNTKYINPFFTKTFGYSLYEIPNGKRFNELVFPDSEYRQKVDKDWKNTIKNIKPEKVISREFIVTCKNGKQKNVVFKLVNIDDENSILIFNDITDLRNAFQQIAQNEENLRVTLDSIGDAVVVTDRNGRITRMNPVAQILTGWSQKQAKGNHITTVLNIINSKTGDPAPNPVERVLMYGKVVGLANHTMLISKDGNRYHIDDSAAPIINNDEIIGVVMVFHDITERYKLMEDVKESNRKLNTLISNLPGIVYRCKFDRDWTMEYVNDVCLQITGYTSDEFLNNKVLFNDIIYPEDQLVVWDSINNQLKKKNYFELTYRILTKQNETRWVWEKGMAIYNKNKKIIALEGFIYDITDEHLANIQLAVSEYKYSKAFKSGPDSITISKLKDGTFVEVNDRFLESLEYSDESEVIGKNSIDLGIWVNEKEREKYVSTILKNGNVLEYPCSFYTKSGRLIHCLISSTIIELNEEPYILSISIDVTDKKITEDKLIESEKKYHDLLNGSADGILVAEIESQKFVYGNNTICSMLGYSQEEILMLDVTKIHPKKELKKVQNIFESQVNSEIITGYDLPCLRKDGSVFYADISSKVQYFGGKKCLIGIFKDITERKKTEDAFRREYKINQVYSKLAKELLEPELSIESISKNVLVYAKNITSSKFGFISTIEKETGLNEISTFCEDSALESLLKKKTVILKKVDDKYPGILGLSLNSKKGFISNDSEMLRNLENLPSGHLTLKNILTVPVIFNKILIGQIAVANSEENYTETDLNNISRLADLYAIAIVRKNSETELLKAKLKAEDSDKLKTNFLENMSHEIRTPMNGIIGFAELLKMPGINTTQRDEYIGFINNSCNVLSGLIDDIIDISKIEAGQLTINKSEFPVNNLFNEIISFWNEDKIKKSKEQIDIYFKSPRENHELILSSDPIRFSQIFNNLIGNALKFTEKGRIEVGYTLPVKDTVRFYVKDTGIGIPKEKLEIIFDRFRQVDESPQRSYGGAGLGLTITKNLIEILDGKIWVESVFGKGTVFFVEFNNIVSRQKPRLNISHEPKSKNYNWSGKEILIVEDDQINYLLMREILNKTKANVIHSANGKEAIEIVKSNPEINIVLMDIQLPGISGYEAMREIKKIRKTLPVIAHTAFAMKDERNKILEFGFDDYVVKPVNIEKLLKIIEVYFK